MNLLAQVVSARRRARWPREKLQQYQQRAFDEIVRFAHAASPFYSRHYGPNGNSLPPVNKSLLMDHLDDVFTDRSIRKPDVVRFVEDHDNVGRLFLDKYIVLHTSGTTGAVGYFLFDLPAWDGFRGLVYSRPPKSLSLARNALRVFSGGARIATLCATKGHFALRSAFLAQAPSWESWLARKEAFEITDPLPQLVARLNAFNPHYLGGYASIIAALAGEQEDGRLRIHPEMVSTGAEPLRPDMRERIQRAFGARIYDVYGATEAMCIAVEGECGALHVMDDFCVLEPVDGEGRAVPPGEWSAKVYVTNLLNRIMPIIRYELTDRVRTLPEECGCGVPFSRIEIQGRADDELVLSGADGRPVRVPPIPLIALLLEVPGIRQSQVIQESDRLVRVLLVPESPSGSDDMVRSVEGAFKRYFDQSGVAPDVDLSVERMEELIRMPSGGKVRQIWNRSDPPLTTLPGSI